MSLARSGAVTSDWFLIREHGKEDPGLRNVWITLGGPNLTNIDG